jgi:hypothetical protein
MISKQDLLFFMEECSVWGYRFLGHSVNESFCKFETATAVRFGWGDLGGGRSRGAVNTIIRNRKKISIKYKSVLI